MLNHLQHSEVSKLSPLTKSEADDPRSENVGAHGPVKCLILLGGKESENKRMV